MDIKQIIKVSAAYCGMSFTGIAKALDQTPQNLSNKLQRNDIKISTLEAIADTMGCHIVLSFVKSDTGETLITKTSGK